MNGRGAGQFREIVRGAGRELEVDRPWLIAPDADTAVVITGLFRNGLAIDNDFIDCGVAVTYYGFAVDQIAAHKGLCFLRTSRPKTPVIYGNDEQFPIGGAKVLRDGSKDVRKEAANSLAKLMSPQSLPALKQAAREDIDKGVRKAAQTAVQKIEPAPVH